MDSNLDHGDQHYHDQRPLLRQPQQQMNSALTRYKSAPSSYFANLLNTVNFGGEDFDEVLNPLRVSSPETDRIFQRFVSSGGSTDQVSSAQNPLQQSLCQLRGSEQPAQQQFLSSMKHEQQDFHSQNHHHQQQQQQQQQHMFYQGQSQEGHNSVVVSTSAMDNSFMATNSVAMDRLPPMRMSDGGGGNANLIRQSSSPAGFFSQLNVESGFSVMRGMGNYGTSSGGARRAESSFPSAKRMKNQMDFSSGQTSSSGLLARIPEIDGKSMGACTSEDETQHKDENYNMDGTFSSWDDSSILSENFLIGLGESDRSSTYHDMDLSENQSNEGRSRPPTTLTHHLSLPTSSAELSAMFQDAVPLRIRAKRGCATHPRSIAERVRRTKISERMRKLQELVPNMDKQTNTSDMLDLAVDYIKDLQKQAKTLADQRAKCTCSSKQKP